MSNKDSLVVGIDLGTTFSAIAYVDQHGKEQIINNVENSPITPSVIYFDNKDNFIVGDEAVKQLIVYPNQTVQFIKRRMGDKDYLLEFFGKKYSPQELSAIILKKLKQDAEKNLGEEVREVVITVPAYFNAAQRGATLEAGEIAGLNVSMIIDEPMAASIAYGINKLGEDQTIFVFDLGGGTLDATILQIKGNDIVMLASAGNAELGGKDWDDKIINYVSEGFLDRYNTNPQEDIYSFQELYQRVLGAKITLSKLTKTKFPVNHKGEMLLFELTREKFEDITKDLLSQCEFLCKTVLKKAQKNWSDIDKILLVGGATYMPMVRRMIQKISGKVPSTDIHPDQAVALGAALQAKFKYIDKKIEEKTKDISDHKEKERIEKSIRRELGYALPSIRSTEVTAHPLGVVVRDQETKKLFVQQMIPEMTTIPHNEKKRFSYSAGTILLQVTEGEGQKPEEVNIIGEFELDALPKRPEGSPIDIVYKYNDNKILEIEAIDVEDPNCVTKVSVNLTGSQTKSKIEEERKYLETKKVK